MKELYMKSYTSELTYRDVARTHEKHILNDIHNLNKTTLMHVFEEADDKKALTYELKTRECRDKYFTDLMIFNRNLPSLVKT